MCITKDKAAYRDLQRLHLSMYNCCMVKFLVDVYLLFMEQEAEICNCIGKICGLGFCSFLCNIAGSILSLINFSRIKKDLEEKKYNLKVNVNLMLS